MSEEKTPLDKEFVNPTCNHDNNSFDNSSFNLPTLSADEMHRTLVKENRIGNGSRFRFIQALLALWKSNLYHRLGSSSIHVYAEKHFDRQSSWTYEALRVAEAVQYLPRLAAAFKEGTIGWSRLRELTRVASSETEGEWLEFGRKHRFKRVQAEVKDALQKHRKLPRKGSYGLPAIRTRVFFELSPSEHDLVEKALGKVMAELSLRLRGEKVEPKAALLFLAKRVLETDPAEKCLPPLSPPEGGLPEGYREREESIYTVLYHQCPGCRKSRLITAEGPVEVPTEVVERIEGEAERVEIAPEEEVAIEIAEREVEGQLEIKPEIDKPNSSSLRRKVLLRDGLMCANPFCRKRLGLHAHHVRWRSKGGRTAVYNSAAVCAYCHSCIHEGYLEVRGNPIDGLDWKTRADALDSADRLALSSADSTVVETGANSTAVENGARKVSEGGDLDLEPYVEALQGLGWTRRAAFTAGQIPKMRPTVEPGTWPTKRPVSGQRSTTAV